MIVDIEKQHKIYINQPRLKVFFFSCSKFINENKYDVIRLAFTRSLPLTPSECVFLLFSRVSFLARIFVFIQKTLSEALSIRLSGICASLLSMTLFSPKYAFVSDTAAYRCHFHSKRIKRSMTCCETKHFNIYYDKKQLTSFFFCGVW